jgi:exodeoxyribonuclease V beta subunit
MSLSGSHLIEASAGSGKTFTLVALFVRLILERDLKVDQILVVTFTRAATAELRQRIRRRLIECREALASATGDSVTLQLIRGDREQIKFRLSAAIAMIDSASIYTIHAFAQRALADRAFSAGTSFELELGDTRSTWAGCVKDFWRKRILHHDAASSLSAATHRALIERLIESDSPERWLEWLLAHRTAAHARIERGVRSPVIEVEQLDRAHRELAIAWRLQRDEVETLLVQHPALNHRVYNSRHVGNYRKKLDDYFAGPWRLAPENFLIRLSYCDMLNHLNESATEPPPAHPLMQAIDAYLELLDAARRGIISWRWDLLLECFTEVPRQVAERLSAERRLGYDDLLVRLDQLLKGAQGESLARALRLRYPAALIDEFQDTDALQDRIFATIYRGEEDTSLFLVGDPKQAIYRFRGADVFTYLKAAGRVGERHSLDQNFRSSDTLIAAVNALYAGSENAFLHADIRYQPVSSGRPLAQRLQGDEAFRAPLHFLLDDADAQKSRAELNQSAASVVAREIARMLLLAEQGQLTIGAKPLGAGDIAVLVNRNEQGGLVREALKRLGIGAADHSRGSVFAAEEADWLLLLLLALFESHRPERILNALATPLFGVDATTLALLTEDDALWQQRLETFSRYKQGWQRSGVMRLLRMLLADARHDAGMLASPNAERHLTNLFHLVELMHAANHAGVGLQAQIRWLAERIKLGAEDPEEGELRLESDDNLVQVMTVHKSKGLEFPVVFVPFMFAGAQTTKSRAARVDDLPVAYHDLDAGAELVIDFGGPDYGQALELEQAERAAEDARLLYVALTRAMHRCVLFWGHSRYGEPSALSQLIEPALALGQVTLSHAAIAKRLFELATRSGGQITHIEGGGASPEVRPAISTPHRAMARTLSQKLPVPWRMASFTALFERRLANTLDDAGEDRSPAEFASEQPDHDQDVAAPAWPAEQPSAAALRFSFPRGAAAGACLHDIFEHLQFDQSLDLQQSEIARLLRIHGFDGRNAPELGRWLQQVVSTPFDEGGPSLAGLKDAQQIREMEFHLPLHGAPIAKLTEIARRHGVVLPRFSEQPLDGFLKGFIDLVFRIGERYYIVDYKSNWLGAKSADYRGAHLEEAMQAGGYHLQYLLYTVALVRWLKWRDAEFDYQRHFGGVFYLFIRGVGEELGGASPAGAAPGTGIYRARPDEILVEEIDAVLQGRQA